MRDTPHQELYTAREPSSRTLIAKPARRPVYPSPVRTGGILALILLATACSAPPHDAQTPGTLSSADFTAALSIPPAPVLSDMLNPDVTPATIRATICHTGYTTSIRPSATYTRAIKQLQIRAYGYADRRLSSYQEDHVIPLELGGIPNVRANLWPEPLARAGDDDRTENSLRVAVCRGAMSLADAQGRILAIKQSHGYAREKSLQ